VDLDTAEHFLGSLVCMLCFAYLLYFIIIKPIGALPPSTYIRDITSGCRTPLQYNPITLKDLITFPNNLHVQWTKRQDTILPFLLKLTY